MVLWQSSGVCVIFRGEGKRSEQEFADSRSAPRQTRSYRAVLGCLSGQHVSPEEDVIWWVAASVKALLARDQSGRSGVTQSRKFDRG